MALLNVNPTRMSLLDLKRRTKAAERGHKLLKDKQDGLMQQFMAIIRDAQARRIEIEQELNTAFKVFLMASTWLSEAEMDNALSSPQAKVVLEVATKNVMSVRIPVFNAHKEGTVKTYGYASTNALLDRSIDAFDQVFEKLIKLAEVEKQAENMAIELETTRRRVNALQYKMVPDLRQTVKYIKMKLDETERAAIISTMRIKASMEMADATEMQKNIRTVQ